MSHTSAQPDDGRSPSGVRGGVHDGARGGGMVQSGGGGDGDGDGWPCRREQDRHRSLDRPLKLARAVKKQFKTNLMRVLYFKKNLLPFFNLYMYVIISMYSAEPGSLLGYIIISISNLLLLL